MRLAATEPLTGRVAVFTAGGSDVSHLDGDIVHVSPHLANRARLREELAGLDADTYLIELKAAAIDVVAEHALAHGRRVVLATNEIVGLPDSVDPRPAAGGGRGMTQSRFGELRQRDDQVPYSKGLIVLIGGTTGTGKSTVASEVAHRLGITRLTSTDFIRETMRAFFSYEEMPAIHHSSFEAGTAVDGDADPLIAGFVEQSRLVCVGVDAAIRRSLTEGWSMVLEGVHLVPGMVPASLDGARDRARHRRDLRRGRAPDAFPRPRHGDRRCAGDGQVP